MMMMMMMMMMMIMIYDDDYDYDDDDDEEEEEEDCDDDNDYSSKWFVGRCWDSLIYLFLKKDEQRSQIADADLLFLFVGGATRCFCFAY